MANVDLSNYMTIKAACIAKGVEYNTMRKWMNNGRVNWGYTKGKQMLIVDDEKFKAANKLPPGTFAGRPKLAASE